MTPKLLMARIRRVGWRGSMAVIALAIPPLAPSAALAQEPRATAAAATPALDPAATFWVESTLAGMTLRQRVAQLVMPWVRGGRIAPGSAEHRRLRRWIEEDQVGGLIVSRGAAAEFAPALNAAQALARVPLLVVADLETGPGMRLTGGTILPPAMAFGATGSEELAREAGRITGREARAAGIHVALGPVLDLNTSAVNPIINTRAFGDDPVLVARLGSAWVAGAREVGLLTVGKHFPGHGATAIDSHIGLPSISATADRLTAVELVPFRAVAGLGMEGVMVAHIAVTGIDGPKAPPATLSPRIVSDLLRTQLGFGGLVFTDALNMGAITRHYTPAEASIQALLAGADVLLQPPGERTVIDAIVEAVEAGRIPRDRIDESARRLLAAKAAAGLNRGARVPAGNRIAGSAAHKQVASAAAQASITLVRDRDDIVPLTRSAGRILHVVYAPYGTRFDASTLTASLRAGGRTIESVRVHERTTAAEFTRLRTRAAASDLVIASAHVVPREYDGSVAVKGRFGGFVEGLAMQGRPLVAISFGNPYLLQAFPSTSAYLLAWSGTPDGQRAAARALLGEAPITGRLPVALLPDHLAGEGIQRLATIAAER